MERASTYIDLHQSIPNVQDAHVCTFLTCPGCDSDVCSILHFAFFNMSSACLSFIMLNNSTGQSINYDLLSTKVINF